MSETGMYPARVEAASQSDLQSWGEWWEQWGDTDFDLPATLVDFETAHQQLARSS